MGLRNFYIKFGQGFYFNQATNVRILYITLSPVCSIYRRRRENGSWFVASANS